ncbi:MAG TPA: homogentisate 1,2-dioxygenase [Allosphingosinicella sp.]|nr:homogentisate 1,2-dioxygenase [Allosphingosinicella sp.]
MLSLLLSAFAFQPAASPHRPGTAACAGGIDRGLPASLAAWRDPVAAGETVRAGVAVVASPAAPLGLEIEQAGTYGVAIDQGAWIDVTRDGTALRSTAHGHGPACSTIRKIVDFALEPGRYTITLSRTDAPAVRLLVVRR